MKNNNPIYIWEQIQQAITNKEEFSDEAKEYLLDVSNTLLDKKNHKPTIEWTCKKALQFAKKTQLLEITKNIDIDKKIFFLEIYKDTGISQNEALRRSKFSNSLDGDKDLIQKIANRKREKNIREEMKLCIIEVLNSFIETKESSLSHEKLLSKMKYVKDFFSTQDTQNIERFKQSYDLYSMYIETKDFDIEEEININNTWLERIKRVEKTLDMTLEDIMQELINNESITMDRLTKISLAIE